MRRAFKEGEDIKYSSYLRCGLMRREGRKMSSIVESSVISIGMRRFLLTICLKFEETLRILPSS